MVEGKIRNFIERKGGRRTYKSWLKKYFVTIDADPESYFEQKNNYDEDILKYAKSIENWAPATKKSAISCLKNFFKFCNVRLQPSTEYSLKEYSKGPSAISQEMIPDREKLKQILSYGGVKHKALFLTMASSGIRPGEAISITLNDIYLDETPARIEIPYDITKTKESRTTFISSEAKSYVKQWLKVRESYLQSAHNRSTLYDKSEEDDRLFPFSASVMRAMWYSQTSKAGFDALDERNWKNRKRHKMTPHKLRKYFKTALSNAGIPFEVVETLMGHQEGMASVYRRLTNEQLKKWYLKGEEHLLVFERPANQEDLDTMKQQLNTLTSQMNGLLEFQSRVTPKHFIENEEGLVVEMEEVLPNEAIMTAFKEEQKRKKEFEHLTKTLGSKELARKVMELTKNSN